MVSTLESLFSKAKIPKKGKAHQNFYGGWNLICQMMLWNQLYADVKGGDSTSLGSVPGYWGNLTGQLEIAQNAFNFQSIHVGDFWTEMQQ